jgi:hypothetical protein
MRRRSWRLLLPVSLIRSLLEPSVNLVLKPTRRTFTELYRFRKPVFASASVYRIAFETNALNYLAQSEYPTTVFVGHGAALPSDQRIAGDEKLRSRPSPV